MSLSKPITFAVHDSPPESRHLISVALSTTWWLVSTSPSSDTTTPEPDASCRSFLPDERSSQTTRT